MKKVLNIIVLITIAAIIIPSFFNSCANTSTPPSGGDKDTIPPILIEMEPPYYNINHPIEKKKSKISFKFNEYVKLNDALNNIFLSPPLSKNVKSEIRGKKVLITFDEPLDSNITYTLDLGLAIKDNNEGNQFPSFVYTFSTGKEIDSLYISGLVQDCKSLLAIKGAKVLIHKDMSDSAIFKTSPVAAAKTDIWGYFVARNLKPGSYKIYAITDENNNNKYDPDNETVAFLDSIYIPHKIMNPDSLELQYFDMKDTLNCLSRPTDITLSIFKEISDRQFIKNKGRLSQRMVFVTFGAPNAVINNFKFLDLDTSYHYITQFNDSKDSLAIWINDTRPIKDTLRFVVDYKKTDDSLKILVNDSDTSRLIIPKKKFKEVRGKKVEVKDTVAKYTFTATPEVIDQEGMTLEFDFPLVKAPFDSLTVTAISTKQQKIPQKFTITQDTACLRKYNIKLEEKLEVGYEYVIKFPHRIFIDINGLGADSLNKKISLPNSDKLSSITLDVQGVETNYIIELTNLKRDKVFRKYHISNNSILPFNYLKSNKYCIRITRDKNKNGRFDTGNLLKKKLPEKVILYKFGNGNNSNSYMIDLPEKMDIEQTINLTELFR